jgi:hypothetical protein
MPARFHLGSQAAARELRRLDHGNARQRLVTTLRRVLGWENCRRRRAPERAGRRHHGCDNERALGDSGGIDGAVRGRTVVAALLSVERVGATLGFIWP